MTEPVFVDTNVWVYAVDAADPGKRARALEVVSPGPLRELIVSTQALTEFYAVVTRKLAMPLAVLPVVPIDSALVMSAIRASRE